MARLSLRLLGVLRIVLDGRPLAGFESVKERALLAYLAEESHQSHRRETLAGLLWPERTERAARSNLSRVLSNLRRLLGDRTPTGPPFLLVTHQTVRFNPECDAWIDSVTFADLLSPPGPQPRAQLEEAVHLYRGDFLEGISIADSPGCEEWIVLCRERYQRLMMEALHRLVEDFESQGHYERALRLAWRQLDLEPWWEEAHQQLIRLLALSGRRSEALAQFDKCRRMLAEELGVEPAKETTKLHAQIRDETLLGSLPSLERRRGPAHNLPVTLGPFVGRETEIAEIQDCLQDPACRLLTLVGAGGTGKTRLAIEAAADWISQAREDELDRATLVPLAAFEAEGAIIPAIAQATGFQLSPGREPGQQLLDYLGQKRWLLILDGFEGLPGGAGFVADILRETPDVKILVTSRTRLNLHVEHCFPVTGLEFPEQIPEDAQKAHSFAAVKLFLQAASRVQPGFEPADVDHGEISRICHLVRGNPLGILLAAAWLDVLHPAEIAAEISKGFDFLEADWLDVPERQHSLRAVFDQSWHLLEDREREVFQALSVFSGGFTRDAARQVADAPLRDLKALTAKSLLQYTPSGRYEVHELPRQYAAEKLHSLPEAATDARDRHCAYYTAALQRWGQDLVGLRQQAAMHEIEADGENVRAAWSWAVEQGQVERLDSAMEGLERFYWRSGRYGEAVAALQKAATAAGAAGTTAQTSAEKAACLRVQVRALAYRSNFQRSLGEWDAARRIQQRCLAILESPTLAGADTRQERGILTFMKGVTDCMTDYDQGRQLFREAHSLYRELDLRWEMAGALNAWSTMSMFLADFQDAKRRVEEALAINRSLGNSAGVAGSFRRQSQIAWLEGRFEEAERLARDGYAASLEAGTLAEAAFGLLDLGETLEKQAKLSEAHIVTQQSLALLSELGYRGYITQAHSFLGSIDMHRGRYAGARDHAQTGLAQAQEYGPRYCVGMNLLLLGCLDVVGSAHARAHQFLQDSLAAYREIGQQHDVSWAHASLAFASRALGDRRRTRQHLFHSFQIADELGAVFPLLWALPAMALLLVDQGELQRAVDVYALASRYPLVAKSRWFADVAGDTLASAAAAMPAERVAVLEERGRTRNLKATAAELLTELSR